MSGQILANTKPVSLALVPISQQRVHKPSSSLSMEELTELVKALKLEEILKQSFQQEEINRRCFERSITLINSGELAQLSPVKKLVGKISYLGNTILMELVERGNISAVTTLINKQIGLAATGPEGHTALHIAAAAGSVAFLDLLINEASLYASAETTQNVTPLHMAVSANSYECVSMLIGLGVPLGVEAKWQFSPGEKRLMTPLALAVAFGNKSIVEALLKEPNINMEISLYGNIIHVAAYFNNEEMIEFLLKNPKTKDLIDKTDEHGRTPFMVACYSGSEQAAQLLKLYGANRELRDKSGQSAMHWAVRGKQVNLVRFIASDKISLIEERDDHNMAPLDLALHLAQEDEAKGENNEESCRVHRELGNLSKIKARQEISPPNFEKFPPENLVFQGGGPAGIAHAGVYKGLSEGGKLKDLRRVAGTSAGSIIASLVAVGLTPEDVLKIASKDIKAYLDFTPEGEKFLKDAGQDSLESLISEYKEAFCRIAKQIALGAVQKKASSFLKSILRLDVKGAVSVLFESGHKAIQDLPLGLCYGKALEEEIESVIQKATGIQNCTFLELRRCISDSPDRYKHLWVTVTRLTNDGEVRIERLTTENINDRDEFYDTVVVSSAVRASSSIPLVFKPCTLKTKHPGTQIVAEAEQLGQFLDGGMLANLDIEVFDERRFQTQKAFLADEGLLHVMNKRTLGVALVGSKETEESSEDLSQLPVRDPLSLVKYIIGLYGSSEDSLRALRPYNKQRTLEVNRYSVKFTDFSLSDEDKKALYESGSTAVSSFFLAKRI